MEKCTSNLPLRNEAAGKLEGKYVEVGRDED